ncbi:NADH:flavin oxidoreductase/NADH oxidase [Olavius algarvensis associated proteobacterium Delta 3]|nr:NADH:flavin oxidoreductase/NADH oxidase [Olavius algarvensis associated proteobacterium Delta 3]CAB5099318.1 NADH:flavin oxidoreductase/NADH oxidase [Olavius algarvensis associated proteobacterium Delta 3]
MGIVPARILPLPIGPKGQIGAATKGGSMQHPVYPNLFKSITIKGIRLKNRITMAPLYLGYAADSGRVSPLLLHHYKLMAQSGAAMIVVENACISIGGSGAQRTLRCDHNRYLGSLEQLADTIKKQKARAALQINHAGRYAHAPSPVAPSAVETFGRIPKALTRREIRTIRKQYANAAKRAKAAGFDLVELHGGTGYLLAQFVSPRTNKRRDVYGGPIENRIRFPLEVLKEVKDTVGNFPVGYRFLADEWLPDGLKLPEASVLARALSKNGIAYISTMGGTYESFFLPDVVEKSKKPGYMVPLAASVKKQANVPIIAAGRLSTPRRAESILKGKQADLIGLARPLWVDPDWVRKARNGQDGRIVKCSPKCNACMELVMRGKPAFCPRWTKEKRVSLKEMFQ